MEGKVLGVTPSCARKGKASEAAAAEAGRKTGGSWDFLSGGCLACPPQPLGSSLL